MLEWGQKRDGEASGASCLQPAGRRMDQYRGAQYDIGETKKVIVHGSCTGHFDHYQCKLLEQLKKRQGCGVGGCNIEPHCGTKANKVPVKGICSPISRHWQSTRESRSINGEFVSC